MSEVIKSIDIDENIIKSGETAIFKKDDVLKAIKITPNKQVVFEKLRFKTTNIIGSNFGGYYKVINNELVESSYHDTLLVTNEANSVIAKVDNRCLVDLHGGSQSLDRDEIVEMKKSGISGDKIVQSIVENSSSFSEKTVFSQKKYLKKKQKKHLAIIQVLRPNARLLCRLYEEREPSKICQMQVDSLSQLLTMANVRSGSKVIVVETCSGVVLGSVLERLAGNGAVVNLHAGGETAPNLFAVSHLNLQDQHWDTLHSLPLHKLTSVLECKDESINDLLPKDDLEMIQDDPNEVKEMIPPTRKRKHDKTLELSREERLMIRSERRKKRRGHQLEAIQLLRSAKMDALIVACRMHPTPIVTKLMKQLAASRPFAVYCEHREPLMELFVHLSMNGIAINLQLTDTFMRYYQILPERSHPKVTMPGNRGFVLSGIKVISDAEEK